MMRKCLFVWGILICLFGSSISAQSVNEEKQLRDSVFKEYHSIDEKADKVTYMRGVLFANLDKPWVIELVDSLLELSIASKDNALELAIRGDYYWHYKYLSDLPKMESCLEQLRIASLKYQLYDYYFRIWSDMLQFYNVRGDTEYARIQSQRMKEEAVKFDHSEGIMYANLSMARSLAASKKEEAAVKIFREVLSLPDLKPMTRVLVHSEIVTTYQQLGKNEEAIKELLIQRAVLDRYISEEPEQAELLRDNRMELELQFCAVYDSMDDMKHLLEHLNEAKKYYTPDCFFANFINYHVYWAVYYGSIHQWDVCFREFDKAFSRFDNTQPLFEMSVRRIKGAVLMKAGRYEEAAHLYKDLFLMGDSLNHDVMKLHQEANQANYNIRKALLEKEMLEKESNWIIVGLILLVIVVLTIMVIRAQKGRRSLLRMERETRKAFETVDAANKMKEVFLYNITHQIREPLNVVVGFSEILAVEEDLAQEQIKEYSESIKKNAELLSQLIFDVLDLSRLESGMMKFNLSECDVVQMCQEVRMNIEMQESNKNRLTFETELNELNIHADEGRFQKVLFSVLASSKDCEDTGEVKFTLSCEDNHLKIVVEDSPLLKQPENLQRMKHDINRLFLGIFKGTYLCSDNKKITITYPLDK